ncbi:MAG: tetratricopeptide repeat protein [Phycisphaerales bacterium]
MNWFQHILARYAAGRENRAAAVTATTSGPTFGPTSGDSGGGSGGHPHVQAIRYLVVREACEAAFAALARNDIAPAQRLVEHARGLDPAHPDVIRARALIALQTNQPLLAVDLLERDNSSLASMRLLLQLARLQAGRREAAHLDLHAWSRLESCPPQARQLLAWLELQSADTHAARAALQRNLRHQLDPAGIQMLWLIDRQTGLRDTARQFAAVMAHRLPHHEPTRAFQRLMGLGDRVPTLVPVEMIDQLAAELLDQPDVIASLVAAQKCRMQSQRVELLRRALARIVDDLPQSLDAVVALAELSLLADDADDARRWAQRGLRADPYHAKLALILDDAERRAPAPISSKPRQSESFPGASAALGSSEARPALRRVADRYPDYRDVRAALARRIAGEAA